MIRHLYPLLWSFILILAACTGGGGNDHPGPSVEPLTETPQAKLTAGFTSDAANPLNNSMSLQKKTVEGAMITLNVGITGLATPSSGAAFDVKFDPTLVSFEGFTPGTFYEHNNTAVSYRAVLQSGTRNRLVIGISQQAGQGNTGTGTLVELQFKAKQSGSSPVIFSNNNLISPSGLLLPDLDWSGGTLKGS